MELGLRDIEEILWCTVRCGQLVDTNTDCTGWLLTIQGSAHGGRRWTAATSTLTRRLPQQLGKTWETEYFEYKNMAVVCHFGVKTDHH